MPKIKDPLLRAEKLIKKSQQKGIKKQEVEEWQKYWRKAGPVRFAEEVLTCPLDVPSYPNCEDLQTENEYCLGCSMGGSKEVSHRKFRPNGIPYHIILSEDQKNYLSDLWLEDPKLILLAAARGAGKTFCFAIWYCWQVSTQDQYSITCMGGSSEQSELIQEYIDGWRLDVPMLNRIIHRSLHGIKKRVETIGRGKIKFPACSVLSSKGPHVNEVGIDEACAAEDKSEDGAKAVKSAMWQLTGKRTGRLILASTADYIHGQFYEYMKDPKKYRFRVYQWSIARHISGKSALETYTDKDPTHWRPNVWWLTQREIEDKRRTKSDDEWLSQALGGASMASGAALKKDDLDIVICSICDNCEPYNWNKCKLCKLGKLGTPDDPTKFILERRGGFDYGISEAPCALTVVGRKRDVVFVLDNDEQKGLREDEKIEWIDKTLREWKANVFIPDPAAAGAHLNEKLDDKGYAVYRIAEREKIGRVFNVINFVEKHKVIIPKKFWYLTQSLRKLAWVKKGENKKIRKIDDHSFDSLQYALVDWYVEESGNVLEEFLKGMGRKGTEKTTMPTIEDTYGVKDEKGSKNKSEIPRIEDIFD